MKIVQFSPKNRRVRKLFLRLPFELYREDPNWVPPLAFDQRRIFNTHQHSFYRHGEAAFFLVLDGKQVLGRLAVLNNRDFNAFNQSRTAHFYLFECVNEGEVAQGLFDAGCRWAKQRGLDRISGPKGMTPLDGLGLLVRGFDHRPAFGMPYNPAYYPDLISGCGFRKVSESVSGYLAPDLAFPEKVQRVAERVQERRGFKVMKMRSRRDLRHAVRLLGEMYNGALAGTEDTMPLTSRDLKTMAQGLLWIAQPGLVKLIMKGEEPAGFLLAYPDISAAIQQCRGRLFPWGWAHLLLEKQKTAWVNINGAGIVEKYRGLGATALLYHELHKTITESGQFDHAEVVQIGVENERMLLELRGMGIDFYKAHGIFERGV